MDKPQVGDVVLFRDPGASTIGVVELVEPAGQDNDQAATVYSVKRTAGWFDPNGTMTRARVMTGSILRILDIVTAVGSLEPQPALPDVHVKFVYLTAGLHVRARVFVKNGLHYARAGELAFTGVEWATVRSVLSSLPASLPLKIKFEADASEEASPSA